MKFAAAAALIAGLVLSGWLVGCNSDTSRTFTGYIEGDLVLVGPDESGRVDTLAVKEGDTVEKDAPLFMLDHRSEDAALATAKAQLEQADAALVLSKVGLERAQRLRKQGVVAQSRVDDARAAFDRDNAAVTAARAAVTDAETHLARRSLSAPVSGAVQEIYFRPGEVVSAGRPVVALLPPGNLKVRFYVPETFRALMRIGESVHVGCDACPQGLTAKISFVSREAEYAPPVIFSREERRKLLFMVEARPGPEAQEIPVGQPVTVSMDGQPDALGS
jgi:HlyD family secretion protein